MDDVGTRELEKTADTTWRPSKDSEEMVDFWAGIQGCFLA